MNVLYYGYTKQKITWLYNFKEKNTNLIWNSCKITINISIINNNFSTPNQIKYNERFHMYHIYVCVW